MTRIRLVPLERDDREQFVLDNQEAFKQAREFSFIHV